MTIRKSHTRTIKDKKRPGTRTVKVKSSFVKTGKKRK